MLIGVAQREVARLRGEYRRGLIMLCDVGFSGIERVAWERNSLRRAAELGVRIAAISIRFSAVG